MDVQPTARGNSENQTAWAIFVVRILLDHFACQYCLNDFVVRYSAGHHLSDRVQ